MEILRFEEATSPAPKRKKSSKGYITLGFVAAVFGIGSAFASSTITINSNSPIALGQGVTLVTACDDAISIAPITAMTVEEPGGPTFYMTELQIKGINALLPNVETGIGCGGKVFDIQIFDTQATPAPYSCLDLTPGATAQEQGGDPQALTCVEGVNKLSFQVSAADSDRNYTISFDQAPSDISYITLVSRES
jgi:hypothetical protein